VWQEKREKGRKKIKKERGRKRLCVECLERGGSGRKKIKKVRVRVWRRKKEGKRRRRKYR